MPRHAVDLEGGAGGQGASASVGSEKVGWATWKKSKGRRNGSARSDAVLRCCCIPPSLALPRHLRPAGAFNAPVALTEWLTKWLQHSHLSVPSSHLMPWVTASLLRAGRPRDRSRERHGARGLRPRGRFQRGG